MAAPEDPQSNNDEVLTRRGSDDSGAATLKHRDQREDHAERALELVPRFEVRRRLGSGGMGSVFEVLDRERDAVVALKTMHLASPERIAAFKREFRSLADISHPQLVGLHELIAVDGRWYFTMDIVDGVRFDIFVRSTGRAFEGPTVRMSDLPPRPTMPPEQDDSTASLPPTRANVGALRETLAQCVEGLAALHRAGKVHCDVKPSNVLVTAGGEVRIVDFGLVHDRGGLDNRSGSAGTPRFMSPEQAAGHNATPASDWYALGVMLYAALVGRTPYEGNAQEVLARKQVEPAPPPSLAVSGVPMHLDRLCTQLLQIDPRQRPDVAQIRLALATSDAAAPVTGPLPSVFLGRDDALSMLDVACRDVAAQKASVCVLVDGESGIGKTELLRQFAWSRRFSADTLLLSSRCHLRESVPYNALDGIVDDLAEVARHLDETELERIDGMNALTTTFPVLGFITASLPSPPHTTAHPSERRRAFAALSRLLTIVAGARTVVLIIDDMQWADRDSAFGLAQLLSEGPPVVLVGSHRDAEGSRGPIVDLLSDEARRPGCEVRTLSLEPLSSEHARACAARVLVNHADGADLARTISAESHGHPFFVMELARHVLESGDALSATMHQVVDARLDVLSREARRVIDIVAIAGHAISQGAALQAAALSADGQAVVASLRARSLVSARGLRDEDGVEIYHDRIRRAVLERMPAPVKQAHHHRLAETLEARGEGSAESLADHFERGGALLRAAAFAEAAARHAFDALAFDHAAALFTQAVRCRGSNVDTALLHQQARSLANAARGAEAADVLEICASRTVGRERLGFQNEAAEQFLVSGRLERGLATLQPLLDEVGLTYPRTEAGAFLSIVARMVRLTVTGTKLRQPPRALTPDQAFKLDVCWAAQRGIKSYDTSRGGSFMLQFLDLALRAGDPRRVGHGLIVVGEAVAFDGSARSARQALGYIEQATTIARELDDRGLEALTHTSRGMVAMFGGRWRDARAAADTGVAMLEDGPSGYGHEHAIASMVSILCCEYMGDYAQLRERVARSLRDADQRGNRYTRVQALIYDSLCRLAADDTTGARDRVHEALRMWPNDRTLFQHWLALKAQLSVDLYVGDAERANHRLEQAARQLEAARLTTMTFLRINMLAFRAIIQTELAAQRGFKRHWHLGRAKRTILALEREKNSHADAVGALARAGVAHVAEDHDTAARERTRAATLFENIDMHFHAAAAQGDAAAQQALRRAGVVDPQRWLRIYGARAAVTSAGRFDT